MNRSLKQIVGIAAGIACLTVTACTQQRVKNGGNLSPVSADTVTVVQDVQRYEPPVVPVMIRTKEERQRFLALHYWNDFDFADTTHFSKPEVTEQALADYLYLLGEVSADICREGISLLLDKALTADSTMFAHFTGLLEHYLYEPNSPYRNDEAYIAVLEYITASLQISKTDKLRPAYQLKMIRKNRIGEWAADFTYTLKDGSQRALHGIRSEYTVLFFNNPDCEECRRIKAVLTELDVFVHNPAVTILSIYPDEDVELWRRTPYPDSWINGYGNADIDKRYDLRAIPSLYLLDREKRVILKNAPIEAIIDFLNQYRT